MYDIVVRLRDCPWRADWAAALGDEWLDGYGSHESECDRAFCEHSTVEVECGFAFIGGGTGESADRGVALGRLIPVGQPCFVADAFGGGK